MPKEPQAGDEIVLPLHHRYSTDGKYLGVFDDNGKRLAATAHKTIDVLTQMLNVLNKQATHA